MDKREFIVPGAILGIVLIIAIGLLITHNNQKPPLDTNGMATSTPASTTVSTTGGSAGSSNNSGSGTSAGPIRYYPYGSITLSLNQVAGFKDGLSIRPTEVLEDSRCPAGVMCIQAGTVRIALKTSINNESMSHTVKLGEHFAQNGTTITFVSVEPLRSKDAAPTSSAYRFTFTVERGSASDMSAAGPCYIGGCSGQICSDQRGAISTCEYRAEYGCYRSATCERQTNGKCGFTQSDALKKCLANPPTE